MSREKLVVGVLLLDLLAVSAWAIASDGITGIVDYIAAMGPWGWQLGVDLVVALVLVMGWMWRDARSRGKNPVGWMVATVLLGSIAPLVYLLLRPAGEARG
ncbi:MAG: hypothetical protein H6703_13085 [Myxococcales bacterium]|nr:hypothetical protein [Myxococcales bacterium]MCB9543367.1 hypothetical protein [Myxococcales bacterium]MCB9553691.1 hypothetical protein [Myxococcales bacterium]